jgi:hypothetical protein
MKKTTLLIVCNGIGLLLALGWAIFDFGWESLVACITLAAALIAQVNSANKSTKSTKGLTQNAGVASTNYQSGRDMNINHGQTSHAEKIEQQANKNSVSLQAQTQEVTINQGISYTEAKEIAHDVFNANFLRVSKVAHQEAQERFEEFTNKFLDEIKKKNDGKFYTMSTPSMQASLYEAQKEYAKSGDKDLADILIGLLVEREGIIERNLQQIVLSESIEVASKLTLQQLDALTLAFLLRMSKSSVPRNLDKLDKYLTTDIKPFIPSLSKENSFYQHFDYCGCASISLASRTLEAGFRQIYKGLFSKGFTLEEFITQVPIENGHELYTMPCLHDTSKLQIRFMDDETLTEELIKCKVSTETIEKAKQFFNAN